MQLRGDMSETTNVVERFMHLSRNRPDSNRSVVGTCFARQWL